MSCNAARQIESRKPWTPGTQELRREGGRKGKYVYMYTLRFFKKLKNLSNIHFLYLKLFNFPLLYI